MAIIRSLNNQDKTINSLYPRRKIGIIDIYDQSTKDITLEYKNFLKKIGIVSEIEKLLIYLDDSLLNLKNIIKKEEELENDLINIF